MLKAYKFSAIWCPACLVMSPIWDKLDTEFDLNLETYDYDMDKEMVEKYQVGKILPEVILYKDDKEVERFVGEYAFKYLHKVLEGYDKND